MRCVLRLILTALTALLLLSSPAWPDDDIFRPDCSERVACQEHATSRSLLCMEFSRRPGICRVEGIVGGEHISTVLVTGSPRASYLVKFFRISGRPDYSVSGEDVRVIRIGGDQFHVVMGPDARSFDIELSAHPFGRYRLMISGREPGPPAQ